MIWMFFQPPRPLAGEGWGEGSLWMRTVLIVIMWLLSSSLPAAIYQWTDGQGVVHFSDVPQDGATQIHLPKSQTDSPQATPQQKAPMMTPDEVEKPVHQGYKHVAITQPQDEATVRNNQGYVPVMVEVQPDLAKGDKLQLIYDGHPVGQPKIGLIFALDNVTRGTHTLAVQIVDPHGQVIMTSPSVTIFMHQSSLFNRPNPIGP